VATDSREVGGAEIFLTHLLACLPAEVDVSVLGDSPLVLDAVRARRPDATALPLPGGTPAAVLALLRRRPDVLHVNLTAFISCRPILVAALLLRVPTVLVDHLPTPGLAWRGRALQRLMTRFCSARVSVSPTSSRQVEHHGGLRAGSVGTILNGVPVPRATTAARSPREHPTIGVLARLEEQKGLDVMLRALVQLPGVVLQVAGEGSQEQSLRGLAADLGVAARTVFRGQLAPGDLLADVDLLAVPSRHEALPLVVLEAMRAGVPLVASAVGGIPDVIEDGATGLLVPPEQPDALARACRRLLDDEDERGRVAARAREFADACCSDTAMAAAYDRLYRRAAGRSRALRRRRSR
jgi:glycosyltransferase involved in cell wall biosynthesis